MTIFYTGMRGTRPPVRKGSIGRGGFKCPKCPEIHTAVVDSRPCEDHAYIRRRRRCPRCEHRFTTHETVVGEGEKFDTALARLKQVRAFVEQVGAHLDRTIAKFERRP